MSTDFSWPHPEDLPSAPKRIIWHWTAGGRQATLEELQRYHILVEHHSEQPGNPDDDHVVIRSGVPIARNMQNVNNLPPYHRNSDRGYAAHTKSFNSYSLGIALCGMHGAEDFRPTGSVSPGPYPITLEQVRAMLGLSVQAARIYNLEVSEDTFFSHYEAEYIHGVDQYPPGERIWKWNVTWIPGLDLPREQVGPFLREQLQRWLTNQEIDKRLYAPPIGESSEEAVRKQEG